MGVHCGRKMYTKEEKEKFADKLRENPSLPEIYLYNILVDYDIKFEFQKVMFGFIADFYFPRFNKIVEVDGKVHNSRKKYDKWRDGIFKSNGVETLRIPAKLVLQDPFKALQAVNMFLTGKTRRRLTKKK